MEREKQSLFRRFNEQQLLDLLSLDSFAVYREALVAELRQRGNGLSPKAFSLAFPDCVEAFTGKSLGGFGDADGVEVGIPLRQLVFTNSEGQTFRSADYI